MSQNSKKRRDIKRKRKGIKGRPANEPSKSCYDFDNSFSYRAIEVMGMGDGRMTLGGISRCLGMLR